MADRGNLSVAELFRMHWANLVTRFFVVDISLFLPFFLYNAGFQTGTFLVYDSESARWSKPADSLCISFEGLK